LYNADVKGAEPGSAISAGLSNRREVPPTTPFLLEAIAQELTDLPEVLEALKNHRPRPLKDLEFVAVDGVSYLYDPARSRAHLAQDARAIQAWLQPAPTTPLMQLAVKDPGYESWVQHGRPTLEDPAGQPVIAAYRREVASLRALMRALFPSDDAPPSPLLVPMPVPPKAAPAVERVLAVQRVKAPAVQRAPAVERVPAVHRIHAAAKPVEPPPPTLVAPAPEPPRVAPKRIVVRPGVVRQIVADAVRGQVARTENAPTKDAPTENARTENAPTKDAPTKDARTENARTANVQAPEPQEPGKKRRKAAPVDPAAVERTEVLDDVRAWLRAALPVKRPTLVRYGLWERAEAQFGSWDEAVAAAGIPVPNTALWQLPARDPDLSFDILVEALPDEVVARLCSVTLAKVRRRRRDNGAPDPARQLHRRVLATNQLGVDSDEVIAAQLGVSAEAIAQVREAERHAATSSDSDADARPEDSSSPS
jgi:hypothetical protein